MQYIGEYSKSDFLRLTICTHKFESGQLFPAVVTGYYFKESVIPISKVVVTFSLLDDETGIYLSNIDLSTLDRENYILVVHANINTVEVAQAYSFKIR